MNKKMQTITLLAAVIAVLLSAAALVTTVMPRTSGGDIQYVMYLGTNHKDSNEPVFPPEEAKEKAEEILVDYFGGYTIQEASGGWKDGDKLFTEYTLVIYLSDTELEDVHSAADKLITEFGQSSVLIQANSTVTEFYTGNAE